METRAHTNPCMKGAPVASRSCPCDEHTQGAFEKSTREASSGGYSYLSATIGSTFAARRAGM
ncbi:MAG: hypothetical protein H0V27_12505 [Pyrinomonadaceae bacterium]|nr:hypothetical protein [Pyrinomonadaceae bacterium]